MVLTARQTYQRNPLPFKQEALCQRSTGEDVIFSTNNIEKGKRRRPDLRIQVSSWRHFTGGQALCVAGTPKKWMR